jgi:cyanophycinase
VRIANKGDVAANKNDRPAGGKRPGRQRWPPSMRLRAGAANSLHNAMMRTLLLTLVLLCSAPGWAAASGSRSGSGGGAPARHGTLLLIGGALLDDNRPVYQRFLELASARGRARVVIVTAASLEQDESANYKIEALRTWDPTVVIEVVRRETPTAQTVAAIDGATALFFTGGDQARVTARYRPGDADTPEWLAMRRLLDRNGVIAGTSAGDAMMGEVMFLGGGSATALGIAPPPPAKPPADEDADEEDPSHLGPRIGPGMRFMPFGISDSHFFERDRIGRLVAALEATNRHLGIGVGEDAAIEVDLATGELRGVSVADSLVINTAGLRRAGLDRMGLLAHLIGQGERMRPAGWLARTAPAPACGSPVRDLPPAESGDDRPLVSWRLFRLATRAENQAVRQRAAGYSITACAAGHGNVAFEIRAAH